MACNCIETIQNQLREETGDPNGSIDTGFHLKRPEMTMSLRPAGLVFRYRPLNVRTGRLSPRRKLLPLTPVFCPFCGKAYEGE